MSYAPCKNPQCNSFGKPHPNCRCYGEMAKGGDVAFCGDNRTHDKSCQYFKDGGEATWGDDAQDVWDNDAQDVKKEPAQAPIWGKDAEDDPSQPPPQSTTPENDSMLEQGGTFLEGAAHGAFGPLATGAELGLSAMGVPGLSAEDQKRRQERHPLLEGAGEVGGFIASTAIPGLGLASTVGRAAKLAEGVSLGSKFLSGAIENGLIAAEDEASKMALGQGDPEHATAYRMIHILGAAGVGGLLKEFGVPGYGVAKNKLSQLAESQIGQRAEYFMRGFADMADPAIKSLGDISINQMEGAAKSAYETGKNLAKFYGIGNAALIGEEAIRHGYKGWEEGGASGALKGVGKALLIGMSAKYAAPYVGAAALWALSKGITTNILQNIDGVTQAVGGSKIINNAVDHVFNHAGGIADKIGNALNTDREREKLDKIIEDNTVDQEIQQRIYDEHNPSPDHFAAGGDVQAKPTDALATNYPDQNILLTAAKGRVSNYLRTLRPQKNQPSLAFDPAPDMKEKTKTYHRAMDIASNPLRVMDEIKKGTLDAKDMMHLNALYPEINTVLQKKITEKIIQSQLKGEIPPQKVRQSLSLFMGTALSSTFTPQNIQAAQAVFAKPSKEPSGGEPKPEKKSNSPSLTKSDQSFLTGGQALVRRAQRAS